MSLKEYLKYITSRPEVIDNSYFWILLSCFQRQYINLDFVRENLHAVRNKMSRYNEKLGQILLNDQYHLISKLAVKIYQRMYSYIKRKGIENGLILTSDPDLSDLEREVEIFSRKAL